MKKWSPTSPEWFPEESWELHQSAANLTQYACIVSSRHIRDVGIRARFNRQVTLYARQILQEVRNAKISIEEGLRRIEMEYNAMGETIDTFKASVGLRAGMYQFFDGAKMCRSRAGCVIGLPAMLHGFNNIYENGWNLVEGRSDTVGPVRKLYRMTAERFGERPVDGDSMYRSVDISLSGYSLLRKVPRPGSWKLFRNLPSDLERAYKTTGKASLALDTGATIFTANDLRKDMQE